jgi:hypothetical protein
LGLSVLGIDPWPGGAQDCGGAHLGRCGHANAGDLSDESICGGRRWASVASSNSILLGFFSIMDQNRSAMLDLLGCNQTKEDQYSKQAGLYGVLAHACPSAQPTRPGSCAWVDWAEEKTCYV